MTEWIANIWSQVYDVLRFFVEVGILSVGIYQVYKLFHATRGARILLGLFFLLVGLVFLIYIFKLNILSWIILQVLAPGVAIGFVVIFQPELRVGLAKLGSHPLLIPFMNERADDFFDEFCQSVQMLSKHRIGALFAFERTITLKPQIETGVVLDARFSKELAKTLFLNLKNQQNNNSLHDGGLVIDGNRIVAAACIFPVSERPLVDRSIGLRHRAALGLTEDTDAIVVVVSEETGNIAILHKDQFYRNLNPEDFAMRLDKLLYHADSEDDDVAEGEKDSSIMAKIRKLDVRKMFYKAFVNNAGQKIVAVLIAMVLCLAIGHARSMGTAGLGSDKTGVLNIKREG